MPTKEFLDKYNNGKTPLYCEKENYVAMWVGNFESSEILDEYMDTKFSDERGFAKHLKDLFVPENANRPFENDLKQFFDEFYNVFEYDFGVVSDDDFIEAEVFPQKSNRIGTLLLPFSFSEQIIPLFEEKFGLTLDEEYNTVILLYNLEYHGQVTQAEHDGLSVKFVGNVYVPQP
ncbi:MAG: immunity 22 family protein [Oscillospiraceae bacterium]|nr:immunity 22 family protein [Oscillospiraceae bacterium]